MGDTMNEKRKFAMNYQKANMYEKQKDTQLLLRIIAVRDIAKRMNDNNNYVVLLKMIKTVEQSTMLTTDQMKRFCKIEELLMGKNKDKLHR
jgi:hypothetical protein